jgi:hypothetical protein
MRVALDYDGTYTRDPELWDEFIKALIHRGHKVICVTMRKPTETIEMPCDIIYTSRAAKQPFLDALDIIIDVWIDDNPCWILVDAE